MTASEQAYPSGEKAESHVGLTKPNGINRARLAENVVTKMVNSANGAKEGLPEAPKISPEDQKLLQLAEIWPKIFPDSGQMVSSHFTSAVRYLDLQRLRPPAVEGLGLQGRMNEILGEAARMLKCDNGSIWLLDPESGKLRLRVGLQGEHGELNDFRLDIGEGITGFCVRSCQPMTSSNVTQDARHSTKVDELLGTETRNLMATPLVGFGGAFGAMCMLNRSADSRSAYNDEDILVAQLFAGYMADLIRASGLMGDSKEEGAGKGVAGGLGVQHSANDRTDQWIDPVAVSPSMRDVLAKIRAGRMRNLLLTGQTGVGKDHLAAWAHRQSDCASGPFITINCAAIQESLWESEIFGHAKGAFTGAVKDKRGQIELAGGGTLFLNEIGEMPIQTQAKLLSFLDTGEFQRVGETKVRSVRTRILAATNRDLMNNLDPTRFRPDLYYRLAQVHVDVPPLSERPEDVVALAVMRLDRLARDRGVPAPWLNTSTREYLIAQPWQGNARALFASVDTAFERWHEAGGDTLEISMFPESRANVAQGPRLPHTEKPSEDRLDDVRRSLLHLADLVDTLPGGAGAFGGFAPQNGTNNGSIFDDADRLRRVLDQTRCASSDRWNISSAHRALRRSGQLSMSRRTFERRVKGLFDEQSELD